MKRDRTPMTVAEASKIIGLTAPSVYRIAKTRFSKLVSVDVVGNAILFETHSVWDEAARIVYERLKDRSRVLTERALRRGELETGPCEVCGEEQRVLAHHNDYLNPLDIRWLCPSHHSQYHQQWGRERDVVCQERKAHERKQHERLKVLMAVPNADGSIGIGTICAATLDRLIALNASLAGADGPKNA